MAIELLNALTHMTFSGLKAPKIEGDVVNNLLRVSIWGAVGSGATALVSFIFGRSLVQEGTWKALAPHIFKASLVSCATFTLFAAFLSCKLWQMHKTGKTAASIRILNVQVYFLENRLITVSSIGGIAAALVSSRLNLNQGIKSLAERCLFPLMWEALTTCAIAIFHDYQQNQIEK